MAAAQTSDRRQEVGRQGVALEHMEEHMVVELHRRVAVRRGKVGGMLVGVRRTLGEERRVVELQMEVAARRGGCKGGLSQGEG